MPLSRVTRVAMTDELLSKFAGRQDGEAWDLVRINVVVEGFGLERVHPDYEGDFLDRTRVALQDADDDALADIHGFVIAGTPSSTQSGESGSATDTPPDEGADLWTPGYVRVFLSHSAIHRKFVGEVAEYLHESGLHGFVAHDSIEVNREWQAEIERALRTADVFVGLIHPEFRDSAWTNQEVGWARGRDVPLFMIRLGADPTGFPGKTQWPSMTYDTPAVVAGAVQRWINALPQYADSIGGRLITALENATNYQSAGEAGRALDSFDALTADQWSDLDRVFLANNQVHGGVLARRALKPLYDRHGRDFPTAA